MRIQNNIMAMNTHRFYTINNNNVSKSAEKLSSGYRVNRAGDDAAGLAISEKMRAEIRGLTMASKNSQDGISMVQTAEGALTEVQSMLQRMKEMAVQAASDSNEDAIDRPALDAEFQQLIKEIDDVSKTTTFNDMKLLDGSFTGKVIQIGSRTNNEMNISIDDMSAKALKLIDHTASPDTVTAANLKAPGDGTGDKGSATTAATLKWTAADIIGETDVIKTSGTIDFTYTDATGNTGAKESVTVTAGMTGKEVLQAIANASFTMKDDNLGIVTFTGKYDGTNITFTADKVGEMKNAPAASGALAGYTNANLLDQRNASISVDRVRESLNMVSTQRAKLGAIQNRLEHKIANLDNTVENVSAAEARIRDVDIAKEMTNFTKNNILSQAATAMLAQANSLPQGVLSLLQ